MQVKDFCRDPFFHRCSCSLVNKTEGTVWSKKKKQKTLKNRQDGAEATHLLQWDQRLPAVFIWLCAAERRTWLEVTELAFRVPVALGQLETCLVLQDQELCCAFLRELVTSPGPVMITAIRAASSLPSCHAWAYEMGEGLQNLKRWWYMQNSKWNFLFEKLHLHVSGNEHVFFFDFPV